MLQFFFPKKWKLPMASSLWLVPGVVAKVPLRDKKQDNLDSVGVVDGASQLHLHQKHQPAISYNEFDSTRLQVAKDKNPHGNTEFGSEH